MWYMQFCVRFLQNWYGYINTMLSCNLVWLESEVEKIQILLNVWGDLRAPLLHNGTILIENLRLLGLTIQTMALYLRNLKFRYAKHQNTLWTSECHVFKKL